MKTTLFTIALGTFLFSNTFSQSVAPEQSVKYRRSSLHTMLIETKTFPKRDTVLAAYNKYPTPEKYNEHNIGLKVIKASDYTLTPEEKLAAGLKAKDSINTKVVIDKYFKQNQSAKKFIEKWFNRQADGTFDMSLIGERGQYDATEMQANIAKGSARGLSSLADAGEELIRNSFIVVSELDFFSNEVPAYAALLIAQAAADQIPNEIFRLSARATAQVAYNQARQGYSVWTSSHLYQLKWNDSVAAIFYNDMWMDKSSIDSNKKMLFDTTNLFQFEYVGSEKSSSLVLFGMGRTEDKIIEIATIRNVDAVYAKLQKTYDVFKPKTPLYTGYPITAKIGMKEGLEGGEKFEVLEQTLDTKTGLTQYVSKGTIKVDKKLIWDNRYNAGEEADSTKASKIDRTTFSGGKNYYSGMLIKQMK